MTCPRRCAAGATEIRGGLGPRSASAWRQLLPNLGTLVSSAGALRRVASALTLG